jgi:hypothetical protein
MDWSPKDEAKDEGNSMGDLVGKWCQHGERGCRQTSTRSTTGLGRVDEAPGQMAANSPDGINALIAFVNVVFEPMIPPAKAQVVEWVTGAAVGVTALVVLLVLDGGIDGPLHRDDSRRR